jgi:hypothetical protein
MGIHWRIICQLYRLTNRRQVIDAAEQGKTECDHAKEKNCVFTQHVIFFQVMKQCKYAKRRID